MLYIASDHGGFELKNELYNYIKDELKVPIEDLGCESKDSVDYPDYAHKLCKKVLANNALGIVICGTGIGISMAANKVKGIRAALCHEAYSAKMSRMHNNANVLALGGRVTGVELAKSIIDAFLQNDFEGGRHQARIDKIAALESVGG